MTDLTLIRPQTVFTPPNGAPAAANAPVSAALRLLRIYRHNATRDLVVDARVSVPAHDTVTLPLDISQHWFHWADANGPHHQKRLMENSLMGNRLPD